MKNAVYHFGRRAIEQARAAAFSGGVLGNQLGGEFEVEITQGEFAGGGESSHGAGLDRPEQIKRSPDFA